MSGPLATWVGEHSKLGPVAVAVVKEYALAADHWGKPTADVTLEDLIHRTRYKRSTVSEDSGLARSQRLSDGAAELSGTDDGRGRHTRYCSGL